MNVGGQAEVVGQSRVTPVAKTRRIKLDQNENPFELPIELKEQVLDLARAQSWSRYPTPIPRRLIARLAQIDEWREDGILVGNGSNQLILALLTTFIRPGARVVMPAPTFPTFPRSVELLQGEIVEVPLKRETESPFGNDFALEPEAIRAAVERQNPKVVILCSPNNPTGGALTLEQIESIAQNTSALVVVDEAYWQFNGMTALPLLARYSNLVILRTFSKALGLAGLRVGYLLAAPDVIRQVSRAVPFFSVNFFAEAAALTTLDYLPWFDERVSLLTRERERVYTEMKKIPGIKPYPSRTNFILFSLLDREVGFALDALTREGILVRDMRAQHPLLADCLRVSIGLREENDTFLETLARLVSD